MKSIFGDLFRKQIFINIIRAWPYEINFYMSFAKLSYLNVKCSNEQIFQRKCLHLKLTVIYFKN